MLLLTSTSDLLRVVTSAAITTDVHASYVTRDDTTALPIPGRTNTPISTATTTTVVAAPSSGQYRAVKALLIRNRHATTSQDATVIHTDGTNAMELIKVTLLAGECLHYNEGAGFWVTDRLGQSKTIATNGGSGAAVNSTNLVVLASDVINNNGVANTIADVTGLSFAVTAGQTYFFRFNADFTSAATTTGCRWSINGPASPTRLSYNSIYSLTATTQTLNTGLAAYDLPAASSATVAATGANFARVWGHITPSANGTVILRHASEVLSSAITAKAGSLLEWYRTL